MKINVKLSALHAVAQLAADKEIRYYMMSVRVEANADQTILTATNGTCVGMYRVVEAENEVDDKVSFLLPLDVIKMLKPAKNRLDAAVIETDNGVTGTISVIGGATVSWSAVDGKFPDIARVIPQTCSGEVAQFDPALVAKFAAANKCLGSKNNLKIWHNGMSAAPVTLNDTKFFGVLMPYRDMEGLTGYAPPEWAKTAL
jgi:DNA polymerase-3 subunit beta